MSNQQQLALVKKDTIDVVASRVRQFQESGEIHFPANYSPDNAMKSAWLALQSTVDRNGKAALEVCTKDSIANAVLSMVIQGLNVSKLQGYFIVYGSKLQFQRSYFGTMSVTKDVTGAEDIFAQVVYKDDDFEYEIQKGKKVITKHKPGPIASQTNDNIVAAYCTIIWPDGKEYSEVMTMDRIKTSWKKAKSQGTHNEYPDEMAKRTVINYTCKAYLNSSKDDNLLIRTIKNEDVEREELQLEEELSQNANSQAIDVSHYQVMDDEPTAEGAGASEPQQQAEDDF